MLIAFVNNKGGVGKSTLAVHAAVWLHEQGLRVTLVDADAQGSSAAWIARVQPEIRVEQLLQSHEIISQIPRLQVGCDVVIADGPAALGSATVSLLGIANRAILPVGPSLMDINATYQTVRMIYRTRFQYAISEHQDAFLVFNRVQPRTRLARLAAAAIVKLGLPVAPTVVQLRQAYAEASGLGSVVWRMGKTAVSASNELMDLFVTLFDMNRAQSVKNEQTAALRRTHDALVLKQRARPASDLLTRLQQDPPEHFVAANPPFSSKTAVAESVGNQHRQPTFTTDGRE